MSDNGISTELDNFVSDSDNLSRITDHIRYYIATEYVNTKYPEEIYLPKPGGGDVLWRYIDFTQYISLLQRGELHFSRPTEFEDPFEGSLPTKNVENRIETLNETGIRDTIVDFLADETGFSKEEINTELEDRKDSGEELASIMSDAYSNINKKFGERIVLNCWHKKQDETAAMWDLYTDTGIVIKSKYNNIVSAIDKLEPHKTFSEKNNNTTKYLVGEVRYIDYNESKIPDTFVHPYFHKRKSFETEQEVRIACVTTENDFDRTGEYIPVDVNKLVDEIRVHPSSDEWYINLIKSVTKQFGYDFQVSQSDLSKDPVY